MTIVAYKDGVMAADSCSFSGGVRYKTMHPKVSRGVFGVVGCGGRSSDTVAAHEWFSAGMPPEHPPFSCDKDEPMAIMWAKPDGTLWWGDERLVFNQIEAPACIGEGAAANFCEGAMHAGASAERAVMLTIQHCIWTGGHVTVESLTGLSNLDFTKIAKLEGLPSRTTIRGIGSAQQRYNIGDHLAT